MPLIDEAACLAEALPQHHWLIQYYNSNLEKSNWNSNLQKCNWWVFIARTRYMNAHDALHMLGSAGQNTAMPTKASTRDGAAGKNVAALVEEQLQYCRSLRLANMLSVTQVGATRVPRGLCICLLVRRRHSLI